MAAASAIAITVAVLGENCNCCWEAFFFAAVISGYFGTLKIQNSQLRRDEPSFVSQERIQGTYLELNVILDKRRRVAPAEAAVVAVLILITAAATVVVVVAAAAAVVCKFRV